MSKKATKAKKVDQFLTEAANNFVRFCITIPRKVMTQQVDKATQKTVLELLAENGEVMAGIDFNIKLFGPHQDDFKKACIAPGAKLRNFIYDNTFEYQKPARLVPVLRVPTLFPEMEEQARLANESLEAFMPHYEAYCEAGRKAADHNVAKAGIKISHLLRYPTADEFKAAFQIEISEPEEVGPTDMARFDLPAGLASKYAAQGLARFEDRMEEVKTVAIKAARDAMARCETQLGKPDGILYQTLVDEARRTAQMLLDMNAGFETDTGLKTVSEPILEKVAQHADVEVLRNSATDRKAALRAATAVNKKLGQYQRKAAKPVSKPVSKPAPNMPAKASGNVAGAGLVANLPGVRL